jgi:hypothetical protein
MLKDNADPPSELGLFHPHLLTLRLAIRPVPFRRTLAIRPVPFRRFIRPVPFSALLLTLRLAIRPVPFRRFSLFGALVW